MFSERLKKLMHERGLTARKLSKDTGIAHGNLTRWLRDKTMPTSSTLIRLCRYFDVSADWLLGLSNFRRVKK